MVDTVKSRIFLALVGVTALVILAQGVIAGVFINARAGHNVVTLHGAVADVSWVAAGITAGYAFSVFRRARPILWWGSLALFLLDLAQTGIGHLITDEGHHGLITLHVPVAMALFGVATWLSTRAAVEARAATTQRTSSSHPATEQSRPAV